MRRLTSYALAGAVIVLALVAGVLIGHAASTSARDQVDAYIVLYNDGSWSFAQPSPTPTPPPTNTPRPTATATPASIPTQEQATPGGPPATPAPVTCAVKIGADAIRLRADHTTGAAIVDVLPRASIQVIYEWHEGNTYLWARTAGGWFATRQESWWVYGVEGQTERCVDVPGWPGGLTPPAPIVRASTAWGVWSGPGASVDETLAFIQDLQAAGIQPAVTVYGANYIGNAAHAADALVLARPWLPDCPMLDVPPEVSARARVDAALASLQGQRYDWLVLTNECVWPSTEYATVWIRAAIARAAERGVPRLVPVVWPPGHPELDDVAALVSAFETDAGIELGWGMNLYPVEPGRDLSARGGISEFTVWRWRLYRHLLPDVVQLIVTEAARGDGAQRADMGDLALFVERAGDALDVVTFWYNAGPSGLGHWIAAVLWGRLGDVAAAIAAGRVQ